MKQEIIAAVILVALIAFGIINIGFVDKKVDALLDDVDQISSAFSGGDTAQALELTKKSAKEWESFSVYAGVMLRHSDEITDVSESYFAIEEALQKEGELPEALCEKLKHGLSDIAKTESLSLGSLF